MLKKLLKIALVLGVILIVLIVAAAITVRRMFPPEKISAMVHDYVKTNYNREVKFDNVSFRIIGVDLSNFALSEKGGFNNGTFAKADNFVVKIALGPLLQKNIKVSYSIRIKYRLNKRVLIMNDYHACTLKQVNRIATG